MKLDTSNLLVFFAVILNVDGACIGSTCVDFTKVGNIISSGVEEAVETVKKEGGKVVDDVKREGGILLDQTKILGEEVAQDVEEWFRGASGTGKCECVGYSCGCCAHLEEPVIDLNSTICTNASYLSHDYGISLTVTVNQYCIFNETVSVRNPPPICLGMPYVKEWAEACVRLHDIDATTSHLHACVGVEARMKRIIIAKYELGCFDIGPRLNFEVSNRFDFVPSVVMI